jgi:hypothetical protein
VYLLCTPEADYITGEVLGLRRWIYILIMALDGSSETLGSCSQRARQERVSAAGR